MPDTTRTFLGIGIPPTITAKLERLQGLIGHLAPEVRLTDARPFHITLAFLGEVAHADLKVVCEVAYEVCERYEPFEIQLESVGAFPNLSQARIIWAGVGNEGLETLKRLQTDLTRRLSEIGQTVDLSLFRPHVTLGRLRPKKGSELDMSAPLNRYKGWNTPAFGVKEIAVFGSSLGNGPPVYDIIGRTSLKVSKSRREGA